MTNPIFDSIYSRRWKHFSGILRPYCPGFRCFYLFLLDFATAKYGLCMGHRLRGGIWKTFEGRRGCNEGQGATFRRGFYGFFGFRKVHHLQISVGIYIPNSWVMFNWDIYQPLLNVCSLGPMLVFLSCEAIGHHKVENSQARPARSARMR